VELSLRKEMVEEKSMMKEVEFTWATNQNRHSESMTIRVSILLLVTITTQ
jgi:hypothetical protein